MKRFLLTPILLFVTLLFLVIGCGSDDDSGSIEFSWVLGESYLPCTDLVTNVHVLLTDNNNLDLFKESLPCGAGGAVIRNLELDSYQLLLQGTCEDHSIGFRFESLVVVSHTGKTDLGVITLEKVSTDCDSTGCGPGQGPMLSLETYPVDATAPPNGIDAISITATGLDDTCQPFPPGTQIEFFLSNQSPEEVGFFPNRSTSITKSYEPFGVTTEVRSLVGGTARVWAYSAEHDIISTPQEIIFLPFTEQVPEIHLQSSSEQVLADNSSTIELTAEVLDAGKLPVGSGVEVQFQSNLGRFQESDLPNHTAFTDDSGIAHATFVGGLQGGTAVINASANVDGKDLSDHLEIKVSQLGTLEFVSAIPDRLGVLGSGRNEYSEITFIVRDTMGAPFPAGTRVEFFHSGSAGIATLDPADVLTDHVGEARTTLHPGDAPASLTVTATAQLGDDMLQATSPPIHIVGAKPNARFITLSCDRYNVGGLVLDFLETTCTVTLADRNSNKIGLATNVHFATEAGSIDGSALTGETGTDIGKAIVATRTGNPRPEDVPPWTDEPYIGPRNPRDGLVTIIAFTRGEEEFVDINGNGTYDAGEPFTQWEKGEPFIDMDDDGIRDPFEIFRDTNGNSRYDGPNGVWDSDTLIWTETKMLWTGDMVKGDPTYDCDLSNRYSVICPPFTGPFFIQRGMEQEFIWEVKDINLNPLNESTVIDVSVDGKGSLGLSVPQLPFGVEDMLTGDWNEGGGLQGTITIHGAPASDTTFPETGAVNLEVNWQESPGAGVGKSDVVTVFGVFE